MTAAPDGDAPVVLSGGVLSVSGPLTCLVGADGRVRDASPAVASALGVPVGELLGRPLATESGPPDRYALDQVRVEVQRTGHVLRCGHGGFDCELAPDRAGGRPDGPIEGVRCTFEPVDPGGSGPVVEVRSPLFAHAPIGLGMTAADGRWVEANRALCTLTGYDRAELCDRTLADVTAPEDRHGDLVYRRQLGTGELTGYQVEKRWQRADGVELWVVLSVSPARRPGGGTGELLVQVQDVTARRDAEARARLLGDLVECSADAIWARDGGGDVVYWNRAAAQLLGYEASDMVGAASGADLPPSRLAETAQVLAIAAGGRSVGPLETVRRHKDGHDVDVSLTVSPIHDVAGDLLGFASVARDITGRRREEAELRAAHEELQRRAGALERVNAELSRSNDDLQQFVYAASHDLSEPLRAITGFTQLLAQTYRGQLDEEADVFIEFITDGTVRMRQLLDALLQYSRLSSRAADPAPVELAGVVGDVLDGLRLRIAEAGATVDVGPLPELRGDRVLLVQMVQQLLANALLYRRPDVPPAVRISGTEHDGRVALHVEDNGIGIEPHHRERIFRMFTRLHARDDYGGTGIGLTLVKRIVERHRGTVAVDDSPLGGTRVTVVLPVESADSVH